MFIYHFHRIIRHRVVWGIFAGGVSLLFLFTGYSFLNPQDKVTVARIGKRPIPANLFSSLEQEFRTFARNRREALAFPEIATQIWMQVATMQVADELRIRNSDSEIKSAVIESMGVENESEAAQYIGQLRKKLDELRITPQQFQEQRARLLSMRKVASIVDSASWVSPVELDDEVAGHTDEMTVRVITVTNTFAHFEATEAQIRAFFDANTNAFRLPRRVSVQYVAVAVSNLLQREDVKAKVTDEMVQEYFSENSHKLARTNPAVPPTLAEARPQIVPLLEYQMAQETIRTNLDFSFRTLAIQGGSNGFSAAAAAFGLPVQTTPLFALKDDAAGGPCADREFRAAAFDLDPSQPDGRCAIVRSEHYVYAIAPLAESEPHMPVLEEVVDKVRPQANAKVRADMFRDRLETLHADIVKSVRETKTLAIAHARGLNVSTAITFSAQAIYPDSFPNCRSVAGASRYLQPGELSKPVPADDRQAAVMSFMVARRPGDTLAAEMLRPQVIAALERGRIGALVPAWQEWNLARRKLVVTPQIAVQLAAPAESSPATEE